MFNLKPKSLLAYFAPWYIAIGPVYWFLFLPPSIFNLAKYAFAGLIIVSAFYFGANEWFRDRQFIRGSGVNLIMGIVFLSLPAMYFSQSELSVGILSRYFLLMGLLISIYWLSKEPGFLQRVPVAIACVMIPLCLVTVLDFMLNLGLPSIDGYNRLYATGFSTSRTQWSGGLVSLGIFMAWCFILTKQKIRFVFLIAFLMIFLSQISSGGRGGTLAGLLGVIALLFYYKKYSLIFSGILAAMAFVLSFKERLISHLRFDRLEAGANATSDFSSGRLEQYGLAFDLIDTPLKLLFGLGPKGYETSFVNMGIDFEIHNVWLRLFIEYGIFVPVFILMFFFATMWSALKENQNNKEAMGLVIILLAGMFTTLVEPNAIIFSYQNYLCWWLIFIVLKRDAVQGFIRA
ncbi:O-antigen ligase family protein [Paraglaciecola aestuariivivens]